MPARGEGCPRFVGMRHGARSDALGRLYSTGAIGDAFPLCVRRPEGEWTRTPPKVGYAGSGEIEDEDGLRRRKLGGLLTPADEVDAFLKEDRNLY